MAANPNAGVRSPTPLTCICMQSGASLLERITPGEDVWIPDWTSLTEFSASPGTATVLCSVEERTPGNEGKGTEVQRDRCPRTILQRVVNEAKQKHHVDFLVGVEIEFMLLESKDATGTVPSPSGVWLSAQVHVPHWRDIVEEVVGLLEAAGVHVWIFLAEGGYSTYEISLSPLPPLEAVDALHFTRETIKTVAKKNGLHATMHAKPFETGPSTGQHTHLSMSRPELGTPFLAGVLKHFRALCALMLSNVESYQRDTSFGRGAIVWGWQNKPTCVRRVDEAHFEIRPPDAFANFYLMIAAIIGAGMRGVEDNEEVPTPSLPVLIIKEPLSEEKRKEFGVTEDLPADLGEAMKAFKADALLKEVLGEKCFDSFVYLKEKDLEASKKQTTAERRAALIAAF